MLHADAFSRTGLTRRQVLKSASAGFGYLALAGMLGHGNARAATTPAKLGPLAPKAPHMRVKAKRIIFLFMSGSMSQLDTFEYKPQLQKDHGKEGPGGGTLTASKFKFRQHGQTGTWVSELYPNVARHVDKLCFLRALHTDTPAHPQAVIQLHTGTALASLTRPSMGAWLLYGLGTENQDLPGYITINPPPDVGGAGNYGNAFLPAHFQGTRISDAGYLPNLKAETPLALQRKQLDLLQAMNRDLAAIPGAPEAVEGVIQSYELAFKMQGKVPELLDISKEPQKVLDAYGVKPGPAGSFARQCVMARRLSEAGVRFVEICQPGWDHHNNLHKGLIANAAATDQAAAALLTDLEQRGLLDETLVLFGSEFGRLPTAQGADGRDHNITGYPMWLAGAGVKPGFSYGSTDEYGLRAVEGRMHMTDLHATLLALMGLDHEKLTYRYAGRDFRLTDVAGNVATEIFAR
ncbi:sulfatase [Planctomycetaceae bacterium SCGC AG-212-F19]|nr:sulfatase [Planctomycetaceae bacterium SCGC AG-212-F19]